jgi:hypothetical protein
MGQEIGNAAFAQDDFVVFQKRLEAETAALEELFARGAFGGAPRMCGMELEAWLTDDAYLPTAQNAPFIKRLGDPLVGPELSQFNFELNSTPLCFCAEGVALSKTHQELEQTWNRCVKLAEEMGMHALAIGVIPTLRDQMLSKEIMSASNRYQALNQQLFAMRGNAPLSFHIEEGESLHVEQADIMLEAAATSLQVHFQVPQDAAARTYNASLIASAPCVAAAANAPYLYERALWEETRIAIFERAVPSGNLRDADGKVLGRVGFGSGYVRDSLFELFAENLSGYPPILPELLDEDPHTLPHLRLHNGTVWRWNRPLIGFDPHTGEASLRIEQRTMSAGPSIIDSVANIAFYLGLTHALASKPHAPEQDLPFAATRDNFYEAAKYGLAANVLWIDGKTHNLQQLCCDIFLPLAREGLADLGVPAADIRRYLDEVLAPRMRSGQTGAAWQKAYIARHGPDFAAMTAAYTANQMRGDPVHQWGDD